MRAQEDGADMAVRAVRLQPATMLPLHQAGCTPERHHASGTTGVETETGHGVALVAFRSLSLPEAGQSHRQEVLSMPRPSLLSLAAQERPRILQAHRSRHGNRARNHMRIYPEARNSLRMCRRVYGIRPAILFALAA